MKRPEVRGRRGVAIVVDERHAAPLSRTLAQVGTTPREPAPGFWDRFDAATDRFLEFALTKALWIVGGLAGALFALVVAGQLLGWTSS